MSTGKKIAPGCDQGRHRRGATIYALRDTVIISHQTASVKKARYQANSDLTEALALVDRVLDQANRFRAEFLATGDPQSWQLWQALLRDRAILLEELDHD